jgi:hypothetical protein
MTYYILKTTSGSYSIWMETPESTRGPNPPTQIEFVTYIEDEHSHESWTGGYRVGDYYGIHVMRQYIVFESNDINEINQQMLLISIGERPQPFKQW